MKIGFSGHETFVCRHFWLKKGYDFLTQGGSFTDEDAVVSLGVGKNMVSSIRFWMRGFHILDDNRLTEMGTFLLNEKDPYLEDTASLWLLHYSIIKNEKVFIFNSFFNQFLKEKHEFTKEHLISFLKRKTQELEGQKLFSDKTYESDVNVFLRTYHRSDDGKADIEDETANLLIELNLIRPFQRQTLEGKPVLWFRVIREIREEIPLEIFAYTLLDRYGSDPKAIGFSDLLDGYNSPGNIFCLSEKGLEVKLESLHEAWPEIYSYDETAGNRVLQIKKKISSKDLLNNYYGR